MSFIVCPTTCWACKFDSHPVEPHPWWDGEDVSHALAKGYAPPEGDCGCLTCERLRREQQEGGAS